jgi:hypothetical protein
MFGIVFDFIEEMHKKASHWSARAGGTRESCGFGQ